MDVLGAVGLDGCDATVDALDQVNLSDDAEPFACERHRSGREVTPLVNLIPGTATTTVADRIAIGPQSLTVEEFGERRAIRQMRMP